MFRSFQPVFDLSARFLIARQALLERSLTRC